MIIREGDTIKPTNIHVIEIPEEEVRKTQKEYLKIKWQM